MVKLPCGVNQLELQIDTKNSNFIQIIPWLFTYEEFEHTKGVMRIRKAKKDRQYNGQMEKDKEWSPKHTHKTIKIE